MSIKSKTIRKMCVLAGMSVLAAVAAAGVPADGQISIDRALNSPTLTVRYEGANAALVELRVNGESIGTRSVSSARSSGETNFTLNLSGLKDGDNEVEIRLFDRTGKIVGTERTSISTDQTNYGPVFLRTPKMGSTVTGLVEIDMGFGRDLKNVFVSFFVDNNFKKMTNYPPFTMVWDTTGEANGWHEIEAWAIDESSTTYKTRKVRVFLDNPSGRTNREGVADLQPTNPTIVAPATGHPSGAKPVNVRGGSEIVFAPDRSMQPAVSFGTPMPNHIKAPVTQMSGYKATPTGEPTITGYRPITPTTKHSPVATQPTAHGRPSFVSITPTTSRNVSKSGLPSTVVVTPVTHASAPNAASTPHSYVAKNDGLIVIQPHGRQTLSHLEAATTLVRITKGRRLPNLATFEIVMNSSILDFPDAQPRVDGGIPMTPFRYLFEKSGGTVDWSHQTKVVTAKSEGHDVSLRIGDKLALVNKAEIRMETAPYIDQGRTIVPLSFINDALNVNVDYDKETGHVLISSKDK